MQSSTTSDSDVQEYQDSFAEKGKPSKLQHRQAIDRKGRVVGRKGANGEWPDCTAEFVKRTEKRRRRERMAKKSRKKNRK